MSNAAAAFEAMKATEGKDEGHGDWFEINQDQIDKFADVTIDHQFIHLDAERATPLFGGTIAHGFLSLSMLSHLVSQNGIGVENTVMGINYGFDKVRFLMPVRAGKRIRSHAKLIEVTEKDDNRLLMKNEITVEIEGEEKPALVAEWLTMIVVGQPPSPI